jgi:hypothetical protein
MSKHVIRIALAAVILASALSCIRRPLEDMMEQVALRVDVNVKAVANVSCDVYNENIPVPNVNTDMMRVMVYDPGTRNLLTQSFISQKTEENGDQVLSGMLNISYGNYDFLIYNFDTPTTQVSGENNENSILGYTSEIPDAMRTRYLGTKAGEYDNVHINYEPDHLMVAREHNLRVSPRDTLVVIKTVATTVVDTYYIQIHVEGMQYASSATAIINGLSPSNHFGLNERTLDPTAAVCFEMLKSQDPKLPGENKDVLCAVFNTFGKIPEATSNLHVTFNVVDVAGNLQQKDINLDTVFKSQDAIEHHWLLIDETWVIQKPDDTPQNSGGGFRPVVDDWEEINENIIL